MLLIDTMKMMPITCKAMGLSVTRSILPAFRASPSNCPPIVFMHGFAGFKEIRLHNIRLLEYWNGVRQLLTQMGYQTYTPEVSPINPPQTRAEQWHRKIEKIRKMTGAEKVILIAHSQGAIDARLLACPNTQVLQTDLGPLCGIGYGKHIDKLVTIGAPHLGNVLVDRMHTDPEVRRGTFGLAVKAMCAFTKQPNRTRKAIMALSQDYMTQVFNPYCIEDDSVEYYCIAGLPKTVNLISPLLRDGFELLNKVPANLGGGENDGLVTVASALYGNTYTGAADDYTTVAPANTNWKVLGTVMADHVVQVGLPLSHPPNKYYCHLSAFAGLAQYLDPDFKVKMSFKDNGHWVRKKINGK